MLCKFTSSSILVLLSILPHLQKAHHCRLSNVPYEWIPQKSQKQIVYVYTKLSKFKNVA